MLRKPIRLSHISLILPNFVIQQFMAYYYNWRYACRSIEFTESRNDVHQALSELMNRAFTEGSEQ